jgi:hypothetical protein
METHARVLEFLGLPVATLAEYPRYTRRTSGERIGDEARRRLTAHFRPHNQALAALLGRDFGWDD